MFRATTLAILFAAVLAAAFAAPSLAQDEKGAKPKESPEQKLVREYLRENLPTGKWEEVKWWIPRDFKNGKRSIRLKYRAANSLGAIDLSDDAFYMDKGKIVEWHKGKGKLFHGYDDERNP